MKLSKTFYPSLILGVIWLVSFNFLQAQTYNYAEVLQKSMFFYECQRSGALPADNRVNWRGNSGMNDGSDVGVDLTGGLYDAGDNMKFNFPMAYTATVLAWGAIDFPQGYTSTGQMKYLKSNVRWITDYLLKCHTSPNVFWGQVGNGSLDHAWWGSAEVMQMDRPAYKIDSTHPGSDLAGEAAAAMAAASILFKTDDPAYSAKLLTNAIQLYHFADTYRGVYSDVITDAANYYKSWSGYNDELVWGAIWLYRATGDTTYLNKAIAYYANLSDEPQTTVHSYKWGLSWDDKSYGCYVLLAKITGDSIYKADAERNLDFWTDGYDGSRITYTPGGLAWLDSWGALRYAANAAFLALDYYNIATTSAKSTKYYNFALSQINYILGSNPLNRSFICGFGNNPPVNPHHRTAHGAWANNITGPPTNSRHTLYGAMVGGPASDDSYTDDRTNYTQNEPADDYNACFSGALSKLVEDYGGTPLANFPIPETPKDEFLVEARLNNTGTTYTEYSVWVDNHTAWPARIPSQWKYRLYVDISEGVAAGYSASDYVVSANENTVTFTQLLPWDAANNIYYTEVTYNPDVMIWPGGQAESTEESQIRIRLPYDAPATAWDPSNDWSYQGLTSTLQSVSNIPLYVDGKLVVGSAPQQGVNVAVTGVSVTPTTLPLSVGETGTLTATVAPSNATNQSVTWSSSDPSVATVSSGGVVTAVANGTATITATTVDGSFTASSAVTVSTIAVTGVSVALATLSLSIGNTGALTATVTPSNATDQSVSWSTSAPTVATVNSSGVVTAVGNGSATITATTTDGGYTASSAVTVQPGIISVTGVSISPTSTSVTVGGTAQLNVSVSPSDASDQSVSWSSSAPGVATVSSSGLVTGVAQGTATITVTTTDGSYTASSAITVTPPGIIPCNNPVSIPLPFTQDGAGNNCYVTSGDITDINSWNMDTVEINGVDFTNVYASTMPARINGNYYIHYVASVGWAHLEVNGTGGSTNKVAVTGVSVAPTSATVDVNSTTSLTATVSPSNATDQSVSWSSSAPSIATVSSSGVVTGVAPGNATITVTTTDGGYTATSAITVNNTNIAVTGVSVIPTSATVDSGSTTSLMASIAPSNATDQLVSWSTSNASVATVSSNGVVMGVAPGSATITVTTDDGGYTATSAITVNNTNVAVTGVSVAPTSTSVDSGSTTSLTASIAPSNATDQLVSWSTSDASVATVSSSGVVTGVAPGTATITVTTDDGGYTASSTVTVNSVSGGGSVVPCTNPVTITVPFTQDGVGNFCWVTSQSIAYINSWNMDTVEVNGVDYTNVWSNTLPAPINGNYYIHYVASVAWAHFEAPATKSAASMSADQNHNVTVYPVPFKTTFILDISGSKDISSINIFNQQGQLVDKFSSSQLNKTKIELGADYQSGLYFIQILHSDSVETLKVIKE